ncbi:MAG TPA: thioredoxin-disulfide reductase [Flavobacteriales bacterium]|nr:thioredoxin-disulfide reductase [Flavobacteriales bacterium]
MSAQPEHVKCLIIGSGPAGYTAAVYAARADMKPVLYQGMQPGGQLTETTDVDNYPGYPEGINGPQMMMDFEAQAKRFDTDVRNGWVTEVDFTGPVHKIWVEQSDDRTEVHADSVIISTGASAKWLGLESEIRLRDAGGGVSACAVCDGFFYRGQEVVIVGAGDTACEEASYLAKLCSKVTMLVRRDEMRASRAMQNRVLNLDNIEVLWNTETIEVIGKDGVEGARVKNNQTEEEQVIPCTGFFVAIGHKPNTDMFKGWIDLDEQGYIVYQQPGTSKTNREGVFVSGDAADKTYRQAVTAAGTGCMAALDAERYLASRGIH